MKEDKVETFVEFKLNQKIVNIVKKTVNIVGITSYILGMIFGALIFKSSMSSQYSSTDYGMVVFIISSIFYFMLLWVVNRGLNKYKELE